MRSACPKLCRPGSAEGGTGGTSVNRSSTRSRGGGTLEGMDNKIALITGANKGIGLEAARLLAMLPATTVLVGARDEGRGRTAEAALRQDGADAAFVQLDVTDMDSVQAAAKWIESEFGRLDILINNAGISRSAGQVEFGHLPSQTSLAQLRDIFETNVFGLVSVTNAMLPLLRKAPAAHIVNVSSGVGSLTWMSDTQGPMAGMASVPYPASKTTVNMVTVMYAKELRDTPIKINAANPGYCATDLNGHNGFLTARQGAEVLVQLATLPADGPSGQLWGDLWPASDTKAEGEIPW
jgi:NAD(P)-dependent dehydrogenase (short-subunit alcohol dehydrogenase family)